MLSPYHPLQLVLGLMIWTGWFVVIYGGVSIGCMLAPPGPEQGPFTWLNLTLLAGTLAISGVLVWFAWRCRQALRTGAEPAPEQRFIARAGMAMHVIGALSILALAIPALRLPPCI